MDDRELLIQITVRGSHPEFLHGLDLWLSLDLINDQQVKRICKNYLTCPLPVPVVARVNSASEKIPLPVETISVSRERSNVLTQVWQAFRDELSVRWLLFLGVFLVIGSSGVLAASQWSRFPTFGQYAVLWTYTVVFWGVSYWTKKQENLRLTSQTLQTIALLLIPINFWAIDSFSLWNNALEWMLVGLATITLLGIAFLERRERLSNIYSYLAFCCLCFLHWGWQFLSFSLIAVYLGVFINTLIIVVLQNRQRSHQQYLENFYVTFALTVLLVRAIFIVSTPIQQLGLAIGILGWTLIEGRRQEVYPQLLGAGGRRKEEGRSFEGRREEIENTSSPTPLHPYTPTPFPLSKILENIGFTLLFLAWCVCVGEKFPIQAIAISGLALHRFWQRLSCYWLRRDLLAISIIGLQGLFLVKELIPLRLRQNFLAFFVEIAKAQQYPDTIYSITLFPYIIFFVWLTGWLYRKRKEKSQLAIFGEWLTLVLGFILMLVSLDNPLARSLNLFLSTITFAYITRRRLPLKISFIYATHILSLLTLFATIDWWFPKLSSEIWASILITITIAEWLIANFVRTTNHINLFWYRSCWQMGFLLTGLSYLVLADRVPNRIGFWGLLWLLIPLTLTAIASRINGVRKISASGFSVGALIFAQFLTLWRSDTRLIGLGLAAILMALNTNYLRKISVAIVHLGLIFSFAIALVWDELSLPGWYLFGAIATIVFWLLHSWFDRRSNTLATLYSQASDRWAICICMAELVLLTVRYLTLVIS
jgi:hypothetical protein